jgi:3-oxoacyl-[acyl-carrier-protein] synthase II
MSPDRHGGWPLIGTGLVTSVGTGTAEVFEALCAGRSGLGELRAFDTGRLRTRHAFEIGDGHPAAWLCQVIAEALGQASMPEDLSEVPVLVGTGLRMLRAVEAHWLAGAAGELDEPHFGGALRERFGACDTHTFAGACSASLYALGMAADLLATDQADAVVVAGVDTITASMYGLLDRAQTETPCAVRPFDRDRRGQLLGEAAAAVVLRRAGTGTAPARAVLHSVGLHCDAGHVTAPDPAGLVTAQRQAHERAGIKASEVDLVYVQATGSPANDLAEAEALSQVFGEGPGGPLLATVEALTGHTSGCSGLLGTVIVTECLRTGRVPPLAGLSHPIEAVAGRRFSTGGPVELTTAQVNAFGFGGLNASAILGRAV